jgi:hypothetical protein
MVFNFDREVAAIREVLGIEIDKTQAMKISMILAQAFNEGMAMERERLIGIIQRNAINPRDLVTLIRRPLR